MEARQLKGLASERSSFDGLALLMADSFLYDADNKFGAFVTELIFGIVKVSLESVYCLPQLKAGFFLAAPDALGIVEDFGPVLPACSVLLLSHRVTSTPYQVQRAQSCP